MAAGKVWLVGAGPGDIGLFTLKGAAVLHQADVVVYDSLVGEGVLAKIPEHARLINVGKRANHHTMVQEDINKVLLEEAEKGNYDKALKYFEEAVARGDIRSVDLIIDIYREITDLLKNQENINLYWEYKLQMARKMQECGKILEDEIKRRGVPC